MINVLVTIEVLDFDHLTTFESKAAEIMKDHGGQFISAFETLRNEDNTGREIHLLEFPSESAFVGYRSDERLKDLADLRAKAIQSMDVVKSDRLKKYA